MFKDSNFPWNQDIIICFVVFSSKNFEVTLPSKTIFPALFALLHGRGGDRIGKGNGDVPVTIKVNHHAV